MEFVCAIGMLMAFLLGAWVRKPFTFYKKKEGKPQEPEHLSNRMRIQHENLLNYGLSGYRQREIEDED